MVLLFWFVCNLWSKFALCPGMGNDSLAICMSKKTPQKWSAEEQCEWKHLMHDVIFVVFAALDFDIVGSSCFPNTDSKDPSWYFEKIHALENLLLSLVFAWFEHCWKTYGTAKVLLVTASAWIFEGVGIYFWRFTTPWASPCASFGQLVHWVIRKMTLVTPWKSWQGGNMSGILLPRRKQNRPLQLDLQTPWQKLGKATGQQFRWCEFLLSQLRRRVDLLNPRAQWCRQRGKD